MLYKSTGDPVVDHRLNMTKIDIEDLFHVKADLYCYFDNPPNAGADVSLNPLFDGKIAMGINLLRNKLRDFNEHAIAGVLAHEYAHVLQIKKRGTLNGKERELQADFMAGYYFGDGDILENGAEKFAADLYSMGDYNFWDPQHHGTPEERVAMFKAGLRSSTLTLDQAFQKSIEEVTDTESSDTFWFNPIQFNADINKALSIIKNFSNTGTWKVKREVRETDEAFIREVYTAKNLFLKSINVPEMNLAPLKDYNPKLELRWDPKTKDLYSLEYQVDFCGAKQKAIGERQGKKIYELLAKEIRRNKSLQNIKEELYKNDLQILRCEDISRKIKFTFSVHKYGNVSASFTYETNP
ncbi:MAG: hypothetical protein QM734_14525 [Cyclobacteriaceae bacterium]